METKLIEIRDKMTFIPAMATILRFRVPRERFLLRRAGFALEQIQPPESDTGLEPYIVLSSLTDPTKTQWDPFEWGGRTYPVVHQFLVQHWDKIKSGDVVDVEFILGETSEPKKSEEVTHGG